VEAIEQLGPGHKALVHCVAGVSRSSSIVAAYLTKKEGWTAEQAYTFIQKRRPVVTAKKLGNQVELWTRLGYKLPCENEPDSKAVRQFREEFGVRRATAAMQKCIRGEVQTDWGRTRESS